MGLLKENLFIVNSKGEEFDVEKLFESYEDDSERVLANDEVGTILYTADLDIYSLDVTFDGRLVPKKVNQISRSRLGSSIIRIQIGGKVASYSTDTIFYIKKDEYVIKIRADKLKKGMILSTGEKVY